jgi:type I restriction enzyme, S subunit
MAAEWRSSTWGKEISLEYGKALRGYDEATAQYRVFGSNGPIGWTSEPLAPGPGVILGRKGAYRGVHYSTEPFFVIDTAYYVVPKGQLDMRWLYYAIKHYRLGEVDDGSPIPSTTRAAVYVLDLEVPPLHEQRTMSRFLGMLDDKIELNRRMNETLEAMARALFKSWFVDFDPVRAKKEGRWKRGQSVPGLPTQFYDLFPNHFVDSELGEIPEGWEVAPLDSVLVLQRGFDLPSTKRTSGAYPVLAASGPSGTHNEFMVRGPGVTTGRSGVLGKVFYVNEDFWPLNTSLWVKEFRHSRPAYAFHLLRGLKFALFNAGSAVPTLNRNHVHNLPTLLPPMELIDAFERVADESLRRQKHNDRQSNTLAALRDTLLPKLISGELSLKEAERTMKVA